MPPKKKSRLSYEDGLKEGIVLEDPPPPYLFPPRQFEVSIFKSEDAEVNHFQSKEFRETDEPNPLDINLLQDDRIADEEFDFADDAVVSEDNVQVDANSPNSKELANFLSTLKSVKIPLKIVTNKDTINVIV